MNPAVNPSTNPAATNAPAPSFTLERNAFGKLVLTTAQGERFEDVVPVRAFPIQAPEEGVSLVGTQGQELAWVEALHTLVQPAQTLLRETLAEREFIPVIARIASTTSFSTPCTWSVSTDRGDCQFVLRGDEDIRRIGKDNALLISDAQGIQYLIRDSLALDAGSKKILDRFL